MKDLIIIMKSDYVETNSEKKLLQDIQDYFRVSDEQLSFLAKNMSQTVVLMTLRMIGI